MSGIEDRRWLMAKAKYRGTEHDNNWVYIITYYNHIGGKVLRMYSTPEENKTCRVLCKLDNSNEVLTVDEHNRYHCYPADLILSSPKVFSYASETMEKKVTHRLRKGQVYGKRSFSYYTLEGGNSGR